MRIFSGYLTRLPWRRSMLSLAIAAAAAICGGMAAADAPAPTEVRDTLPLMENWRFVRDDALPQQDAQASADAATSDKARSSAPEGARNAAPTSEKPQVPAPDEVRDAVQRVGTWALENPAPYDPASWIMAPLYDGLIDASLATGDPKFIAPVLRAGDCVAFKTRMSMYHADGHAAGRVWLRLYLLSGSKNPSQLEPWVKLFTYLAQNPITQEWRFGETPPHGLKVTDRWVWADALYMSPPTIVVLYQATGDNSYLRFMDREYRFAYDSLYDPEEKLFYRDDRFIGQRSPEGEKLFWSRANGWVLAGLALMLDSLPTDYPTRPFYLGLFQEMSRSVAALQGPDGFWNPSLGDPAYVPQPETSGTALFVRAFASGVRQGLLDPKTYWPVVERGWNALHSVIGPDGEVTRVQPIAPEPRAFKPTTTEPYGTGEVLSAATEILRALGATADADPAKLLAVAQDSADQAPRLWKDGKACGAKVPQR